MRVNVSNIVILMFDLNAQKINTVTRKIIFVKKNVLRILIVTKEKFACLGNVNLVVQMIMIANGVKNVIKKDVLNL